MKKIESKNIFLSLFKQVHYARKETTHIITTHSSEGMDWKEDWTHHAPRGENSIDCPSFSTIGIADDEKNLYLQATSTKLECITRNLEVEFQIEGV